MNAVILNEGGHSQKNDHGLLWNWRVAWVAAAIEQNHDEKGYCLASANCSICCCDSTNEYEKSESQEYAEKNCMTNYCKRNQSLL